MATELYTVVFQGKIVEGHSQEQVKQALAQIFQRQPQELDHFFTGKPVIIQKQIDEHIALRYQRAFEQAGAVCAIVSAETPKLSDAEPTAPEDPNQRYHLIFRGEILPGKHIDVVKPILATKFKLTPQQMSSYFSGKPCHLTKAPVDKATAIKYRNAFEKAGARCHLVSVKPETPQPPVEQTISQPERSTLQKSQPPQKPPPEITASQRSEEGRRQAAARVVPPPLPDVLPPMPQMPSSRRQTPLSAQKSKKKKSNLWVLALVLPFVVLFFLGIVAAIAVPNLLTAIQRSKVARTKADMLGIGTALGRFQVDTNAFPVTEDWVAFSEETLPEEYYNGRHWDAWNNWFFYQSDGETYQLISYGKDMREGGFGFDADIVYTNGVFGE